MNDQDKPGPSSKRVVRKEAKDVKKAEALAPIAAPVAPPSPPAAIVAPAPDVRPAAISAAPASLASPSDAVKPASKPMLAQVAKRATILSRVTRQAAYGLGLAIAIAGGWAGHMLAGPDHEGAAAVAFSIGQSQAETHRMADEMRALKDSVAALTKNATRQAQAPQSEDQRALKERLASLGEGIERLKQDTGTKLTQVTAQLDRVEKANADPAKVTQLIERLDRIERQTASLTTGSLQTAASAPVSSQPKADEQKPQQKIEGWVLRDIFDGVALIEGRRGIVEITPGQTVAGLGRIERFERRGRQWVVVTDKGFIASAQ